MLTRPLRTVIRKNETTTRIRNVIARSRRGAAEDGCSDSDPVAEVDDRGGVGDDERLFPEERLVVRQDDVVATVRGRFGDLEFEWIVPEVIQIRIGREFSPVDGL